MQERQLGQGSRLAVDTMPSLLDRLRQAWFTIIIFSAIVWFRIGTALVQGLKGITRETDAEASHTCTVWGCALISMPRTLSIILAHFSHAQTHGSPSHRGKRVFYRKITSLIAHTHMWLVATVATPHTPHSENTNPSEVSPTCTDTPSHTSTTHVCSSGLSQVLFSK